MVDALTGRPSCRCKPGHARNKLTGLCNWAGLQCKSNQECAPSETCHDGITVHGGNGGNGPTCVDVCLTVSCPLGAECFAREHKGFCR